MCGPFDRVEIWCMRQQPTHDPGIGRIGNSLILGTGPKLHWYLDIGEAAGLESETQSWRHDVLARRLHEFPRQ